MDMLLSAASAGIPKVPFFDDIKHTHVEVHHTAGIFPTRAQILQEIRSIYNYHVAFKGWRYIFYNYLVAPDGTVIVARGPGNKSHGTALTVCLMGNYEAGDKITEEQKAAVLEIARAHGGLDKLDWHRHRAAGTKYASLCPGKDVIDWLQGVRSGVTLIGESEPTMSALEDHLSKGDPGPYEPGSIHYIIRDIYGRLLPQASTDRTAIKEAIAAVDVRASVAGTPDPDLANRIADQIEAHLAAALQAAAAELEA